MAKYKVSVNTYSRSVSDLVDLFCERFGVPLYDADYDQWQQHKKIRTLVEEQYQEAMNKPATGYIEITKNQITS